MKMLVDSANISEIESLLDSLPIDGVTTNPALIAGEKRLFKQQIKEIRRLLPDHLPLHAQIIGKDCAGMMEQAKDLHDWLDGNVWIKIPVTKEGLRAIQQLSKENFRITGTAVYTAAQAVLAAKAGAGYVAPYVNRIDNEFGDGAGTVKTIVGLFSMYGFHCKVLAASFKHKGQILSVMEAGSHEATISPALFGKLADHPAIDRDIEAFRKAWRSEYGTFSL
ncbi:MULTISPECIES: transaldolase family protein [Bacillus subtilis group]|uniref:transaldolase family protein n=1 Tax=Bacillus subtilis group TaxID=653685 RepID=UPI0011A7CD1C|nr:MULTISPECIES: transaldolase family protein [Bacillus subtilis group]MCY8032900.1 transaldolase [Bacillus sonorensis]MCY8562004.1 transaldolase [Bacillus sonorensis]MEC1438223.1 transaldolase family protein [Bacillus sonorensis]MEC1500588.1 transaldolase family protein [Bacillus sonorensis]MEC1535215.1 transaldolase family protein [Bacillus sonorensis]